MTAIETTYSGPTDRRGARINVRAADGRNLTARCPAAMVIPYDHALSLVDNHRAAAAALLTILGPWGRWVGGETKRGWVFCRVPPGDLSAAERTAIPLTVEVE